MVLLKKITAVFTAAAMLSGINAGISAMPDTSILTAIAETEALSGECGANGNNLTWTLDSEGTLTISGEGEMKNWAIGDSPWSKNDKIINVIIEDGVTNISAEAFNSCTDIESVSIPDSVTSISTGAFFGCESLKKVTIPNGVTRIGTSSFNSCKSLASVTIPDSVEIIDPYAFSGTALTFVAIPKSVKNIDFWAFNSCSKLVDITIDNPECRIDEREGTIPDTATIHGHDISTAKNYAEAYNIKFVPINDNPGTITGECGDNLTWTLESNGTLTISGEGEMKNWKQYENTPWFKYYNMITDVIIEDGVTTIGDFAFYECNAENINIPDGVTSIGAHAFYYSGTENITLPDSITSIGKGAFKYSSITTINIPDSIISISEEAFYSCFNLTSVAIHKDITRIGENAFNKCARLTEFVVDEDNGYYTDIDGVLFEKDLKTLIQYPQGKQDQTYTLPDSVTEIENGAFFDCDYLINVTIPENVTSIGDDVFALCTYLTDIIVNENNKHYRSIDGVLFDKNAEILIQYPMAKSQESYIVPDSVITIGKSSFRNCFFLASITIPENVKSIEKDAFINCNKLLDITIENHECEIYDDQSIPRSATIHAYMNSTAHNYALKYSNEFTPLSDLPTEIDSGICGDNGDNLRWSLDNKGTLTISGEGKMEEWVESPWYDNDDIKKIVIKEGVTSIGSESFCNCTSLQSVELPNTLETIGVRAFDACTSLTSITIPQNVTNINKCAFYNCIKLSSITIKNPKCDIYDESSTLPPSTIIYGYTDSTAEAYAKVYVEERFKPINIGECGKEGNNLTWNLSYEGTLTISGKGDMADFSGTSPWDDKSDVKKVVIEDGVTSIGDDAFSGCPNLTEVNIADSVTSIGDGAFYCCDLTSIELPDNLISIGGYAFMVNDITSITIPDSVTSIGEHAFDQCSSLTEIKLSENLEAINPFTFHSCNALSSVTIPASVTKIGNEAFNRCSKLNEIIIENPECEIYDNKTTISNSYNPGIGVVEFSGTIYGHEGSTARAYAEKFGKKFEVIGGEAPAPEVLIGDVDGDGKITASDATMTLIESVNISSGREPSFTDTQLKAADANEDGKLSTSDAQLILAIFTSVAGGKS